MPKISPMRMRLAKAGGSPDGEPAKASKMRESAAMSSGCVWAGRFVLRSRSELPQHLCPEVVETAQTDTLPDAPEGVKVEGQVVHGHEGGRRHLVGQMEVAEVGARHRAAGVAAAALVHGPRVGAVLRVADGEPAGAGEELSVARAAAADPDRGVHVPL